MKDAINLIDIEDKTVRKDSILSSNQIKTRKTSFSAISGNWKKFRISLLSKKLERVKSELAGEHQKIVSAGTNENVDYSKAMELNATIARLEEKINILSRGGVPTNYVENRAIKLRKKMMDSLMYNTSGIYANETDKYDSVGNGGFYKEDIASAMAAAGDTNDIDVSKISEENDSAISSEVSDAFVSREEIKSVIDDNLAKVDSEVREISPEDVEKTVTSSSMFDEPEEEKADMFEDPSVHDAKEGRFIHSDMFDEPEEKEDDIPIISREEVEAAVNQKLREQMDETRVSQNEAASAKTNRYDENGFPKRREREAYVPMTDEQIEQAKENIEYEKYEKKYADDAAKKSRDSIKDEVTRIANSRDYIRKPASSINDIVMPKVEAYRGEAIVVPDRDEQRDLHFDYSNATAKDVVNAVKVETSAEGLEALKARALKLKEKDRQSKDHLDNARRAQADQAQRALDIKNAAQVKEQKYRERLSKFKDYCDALEQDIEINMNLAAVAENDVECNRRFIEGKQAEMEDYDRKMEEIDEYISPEAINVRISK